MSPRARQEEELVFGRLREIQDRTGGVPTAERRRAAGALQKHERTIRRWLERGEVPSGRRPSYSASDGDVAAFFDAHGCFRLAYEERQNQGAGLPSPATFRRALTRALRPDERAFAQYGEEGRRRYQQYLRWEPSHRNALWEIDFKLIDVWVMPPDHRREGLIQPWVLLLVDGATRAIVGYALSETHAKEDVLAAVHSAVLPDPEIGPFCGVPDAIRFDNAREFLSKDVEDSLAKLAINPWPSAPFTPHQKGKVERLHRTLSEEFFAFLPFSPKAPRSANPKVFYRPDWDPVTMRELAQLFKEQVAAYNLERPHSSLEGKTPREAWEEDATQLRLHDRTQLGWLLKRRKKRKVLKDGVHLDKVRYVAKELNGRVGERVEVALNPTAPREIDIYRGGEFMTTARAVHTLDGDERIALTAARREDNRRASNERRKASRRAQRRFPRLERRDRPTPRTPRPKPPKGKAAYSEGKSIDDLLGLDDYEPQKERDA